ncbi:uncharacterized protein LOC101862421 [Aplysia californica]|uniref:Uncharacterized protein LOC101862421 n=1 Tax=Aplysia californica TaxID=6500 RepID=A0ABM0JSR3_APLCA|nr:uncharacterized protein LOC101862421 [Aplysia californica]
MADGPSPAKKAKTDSSDLPECPYGARCYRKNPQHFKEFSHSKDKDEPASTSGAKPNIDDSSLPPCKYGDKCYRKNLLHYAEFSHPTSHPIKAASGSGDDTDVYDSEEEKDEKKGSESKDIISKDLSLVKRFSQLTPEERKELIKRAFEEKQKLQQELDGAKKMVEKKDKELNHMQKQLNSGLLLMEGEEEAMKKNTTTYFELVAERSYKEGSASQFHFRLAESQFYRLLSGPASAMTRIVRVEYVVTPHVVKKFRQAQAELKKKRGEQFSYPVLGFHGTLEKNIQPICENGFRAPGEQKFKQRTDNGWYGAGVYFSEYPSYSMGYVHGASKLMLCQVLPGKIYKCKKIIAGASLQEGFDSHTSPCGKELVIFDSASIWPCYVIYFTKAAHGDFQYASPSGKVYGYKDVVNCPRSKVFSGMMITFSGKMDVSQDLLLDLIVKHGGDAGTAAYFSILVSTEQEVASKKKKCATAESKKIPIVPLAYIYNCIMAGKQLSFEDMRLS